MSKPANFISYSHKDIEWVKNWFLPRFETNGFQTHIDYRDFEIGQPSLINMERAVKTCAKTLLICTPDYIDSEFCRLEAIMLQTEDPIGLRKKILPLMLHDCQLPKRLKIFTYADFRDESEREFQLRRLKEQIKKDLAGKEIEKLIYSPPDKVDITRLPQTGYELFGRQKELTLLNEAWESETINMIAFVAYGGTGKSTLVNKWVEKLRWDNYRGAKRVFAWSFYSQGTGERVTSADLFIKEALTWFGDTDPQSGSP
ncbi:MAG: toll/interleukin-1 receptor domain-containing protein, partial [bacterium]